MRIKKNLIKTDSGDLWLVPSKIDRYLLLFGAIAFQGLLLGLVAKGIQLISENNLTGFFLLLVISIPGSVMIWLNYFAENRLAAAVYIHQKTQRIEFANLPTAQAARFRKYKKKPYVIPFQDIDSILFTTKQEGMPVVHIKVRDRTEAIELCHLPVYLAKHLVRYLAGIIGCSIKVSPGEAPLSPLPVGAVWNPDSERSEIIRLPISSYYPGIIFSVLVLAGVIFRSVDPRPPIWVYLGIHFQTFLSIAGLMFLFAGGWFLAEVWNRMNYYFLVLLSFFLLLSFSFPSRGMFLLVISCIIILFAVIRLFISPPLGRSLSTQKRVCGILVAGMIASSFAVYGLVASREVRGFFSGSPDDVKAIAFYKIGPGRAVGETPLVVVREREQIVEMMGLFEKSVSQRDPRHVARHYQIQITRKDGTSFFASIGRVNENEGCILFSSRSGLSGLDFGGYDNAQMVQVLSCNLGLWPKE